MPKNTPVIVDQQKLDTLLDELRLVYVYSRLNLQKNTVVNNAVNHLLDQGVELAKQKLTRSDLEHFEKSMKKLIKILSDSKNTKNFQADIVRRQSKSPLNQPPTQETIVLQQKTLTGMMKVISENFKSLNPLTFKKPTLFTRMKTALTPSSKEKPTTRHRR